MEGKLSPNLRLSAATDGRIPADFSDFSHAHGWWPASFDKQVTIHADTLADSQTQMNVVSEQRIDTLAVGAVNEDRVTVRKRALTTSSFVV